ncbi:MAG TPA: hypothetical protein GXX37_06190 [Clostridiaceae bacterium]|nr:hypothetical protein [Clostridiaceae bacterium]
MTCAEALYEYTELISNNPDGLDFNHALNSFVPFAVGDNPTLLSPKYFKGNETLPIPYVKRAGIQNILRAAA